MVPDWVSTSRFPHRLPRPPDEVVTILSRPQHSWKLRTAATASRRPWWKKKKSPCLHRQGSPTVWLFWRLNQKLKLGLKNQAWRYHFMIYLQVIIYLIQLYCRREFQNIQAYFTICLEIIWRTFFKQFSKQSEIDQTRRARNFREGSRLRVTR